MDVLVIDDDPTVRLLLTEQLQQAGEAVVSAADGAAGWQALTSQHFDIVVCDVMMPGTSGWDFLSQVRAHAELGTMPVVILSARDVTDDVRQSYQRGASFVSPKPYDFDQLHRQLTALVAHRGQ